MRKAATIVFWVTYVLVELWTLVYWGATWGLLGAFVAFVFIPSPLLTPFVAKHHLGQYPGTYIFVLIIGIVAFFVRSYLGDDKNENLQPQGPESLESEL